jgi:hypothetical protein
VIFLLADDLGFGDVGFTSQFEIQPGAGGQKYTFNPPRTPNLDAMALSESSLLFKQFYAGAPVCSPTRYVGNASKRVQNQGCETSPVIHAGSSICPSDSQSKPLDWSVSNERLH